MQQLPLVMVLDNVRSAHNVGAIWRTAEAAGIERLVLVGVTPHPPTSDDHRLPHVAEHDRKAIAKTALGAETILQFKYYLKLTTALDDLKAAGYQLVALEQSAGAVDLFSYQPTFPLALIAGPEVDGLDRSTLKSMDQVVEIPISGRKESLNVSVAVGIALYQLRYKFGLAKDK
jgi:23S rRNA (guanosine2251-2'-O)-methyltransferase